MDEQTGDTGAVATFDVAAAADKLGANLFNGGEPIVDETPTPEPVETPASNETPAPASVAEPETPEAPITARPAPKAWPKEMHEHWGKVAPEVQDYLEKREKQMLDGLDGYKAHAQFGRAIDEAIKPYQHVLQSQGVDAPRAVQSLLQAHQRLTTGTAEQRAAAYHELGRNLGLTGQESPADPAVQSLQERLARFEQRDAERDRTNYQQTLVKAQGEVEAFASDSKAHPYFDEIADDISELIRSGASLQDAYDKAVWMNPMTRAKEVARVQMETESKLKETSRLNALKASKASSPSVKARDTTRASATSKPVGNIDDTLRETLSEIRARG